MEQIITIRRRAGSVSGLSARTIGRIARHPVPLDDRADSFLIIDRESDTLIDTDGYAAILIESTFGTFADRILKSPVMSGYDSLGNLTDGTIVAIEPTGGTNTLFRPESNHNALFATGRCNSNCLMCSQPPSEWEPENIVDEHLRTIALIQTPPSNLGISGGEPTLLGSGLTAILAALKSKFADSPMFMLTNGRSFANASYAKEIADAIPSNLICCIPLYADVPAVHDYIVQSKGAFEETQAGLYNCARYGIPVEIRVVLHKQSLPRLLSLTEFIYRNLSFVRHIALMGLENMGYVKKNWDTLWIDPVDYQADLEEAVKRLHYRQMNVSIYNHPLCVLPHSLWTFARQSISDFKNLYLEECRTCVDKPQCSGLFASSESRHSRGIRAIHALATYDGAVEF
jgi:His-Xaa-Ser system radical SAM maturase HxsC